MPSKSRVGSGLRSWIWKGALALALLDTEMPASAGTGDCGNSTVDMGEQCDDGGANGTLGSCCTALCMFATPSTPCTDTTPGDCFRAVCTGDTCSQNFQQHLGFTPCVPDSPLPPCTLAQCDDGECGLTAPPGTECTLPAPNECLIAECNGVSTICGVPVLPFTQCTDATPGDCFGAICVGSTCSQMSLPHPNGFPCTDETPADCLISHCDFSGECDQAAVPKNSGESCEDSTPSDCFAAECDANAMCDQVADLLDPGAACGDTTLTECDLADTCDVAGACQENLVAQGTECTDLNPVDCFESQCDGSGTCDLEGAPEPCTVPVVSQNGLVSTIVILGLTGWLTLRPSRPVSKRS